MTIIGVIAVLTIPNLMKKWEDHHTVVAVKNAYTIIDNALKTVIYEEGGGRFSNMNWGKDNHGYNNNSEYLYKALGKYLKFTWECGDVFGCLAKVGNRFRPWFCGGGGTCSNSEDQYMAQLSNGMSVWIKATGPQKNGTSWNCFNSIVVDINGHEKKPNKWGYDIFQFYIGETGLILSQRDHGEYICTNVSYNARCGYNNQMDACSTWILKKNNVDYKYKQWQDIRYDSIWETKY